MSQPGNRPELLDFTSAGTAGSGAVLSRETQDLDLNLVRFADGAGVAAHVNREVDVLVIGVAGRGEVEIDSETFDVAAGQGLLIPKGAERAIRSFPESAFVYLTVHRRRRGLMPTPRRSSAK